MGPKGGAPARLERMERYLAGLPAGLDSYPECVAKGSVLRAVLAQQPIEELAAVLPAPLRELVTDPPVDSEWVAEAKFVATYLVVADVRGHTDDEVLAWARERNRALFRNPAYKILMALASPGMLLRGAAMRWSNWHRGTSLEVDGVLDTGVRVLLRFPPGLFDALTVATFGQAFVAALEMAHAERPAAPVEALEPGLATFLVSWER